MTPEQQQAYDMGADAARSAATWTVDGNTDPAHVRRLLTMLEDGDPEAYDALPAMPDLSGEWSLFEDITGESHGDAQEAAGLAYETLVGSRMDALADAWERGVADTFEAACVAELRRWVD